MKAEERKKQIMEAGIKIFSEKGYYQAHVEDIIRKAKAGKGTFYLYFKNKEDLFVSILVHFLDKWEKAVMVDPEDFSEDNLLDYFKKIIERSFVFFKENDDLCNIYLRVGPGLNTVFEPFMEQFENQMLNYVMTYLNRAKKLGFVRDDMDIELASNIIAGAFLRVDYYYFLVRQNTAVTIADLTENFFRILMEGIISKK